MKILAIESSADETAAAIVENGVKIISSVIASSTAMHQKYGGIVPEVAARKHIESMIPVLTETTQRIDKKNIDAIAVTVGPGLIGSLLIGVETAKTLAFVWNKPIIPVNHVLAHMYANFIKEPLLTSPFSKGRNSPSFGKRGQGGVLFPTISLVVSGGHTELYLMKNEKELTWLGGTLDDAAGEAFDKTARLLGFENRGGPAIQKAALTYSSSEGAPATELRSITRVVLDSPSTHSNNIKLPRPMIHDDTLNFSFSGLKAAILREVKKLKETKQFTDKAIQQLAFEVQEAITDVLVSKTLKAVEKFNVKSILLSGGVAANLRLREKFSSQLSALSYQLFVPPVSLCTDNAVYIGSYAYFRGIPVSWQEINAEPDLSVEVTK